MIQVRRLVIPNLTLLIGLLISLLIGLMPSTSSAWGKRGHAVACQTAAYLAARDPKLDFLKSASFDLAYYCNVPDTLWKRPATYEAEWFNHFMDLEIFERELKDLRVEHPFELERLVFNAKFPQINNAAGRAYWRIRELFTRLENITVDLKKSSQTTSQHHGLQTDWFVTAGAIGHYVGDLSQPLHVTENYDGQMTNQKGVHSFFENDIVDELFHDSGSHLESDVMKAAEEKWAKEQKGMEKKSLLEILQSLSASSARALPGVLANDRKVNRSDIKKAAAAQRGLITERLAEGAVAIAEIFRREMGWEFISKNYHGFDAAPEFIAPPKASESR